MDETTQNFINLLQLAFADVVKDNLRRERLKAAATITAAILQNPNITPVTHLDSARAAAICASAAVEEIERCLVSGSPS